MYNAARTSDPPPQMARLPRRTPQSRFRGRRSLELLVRERPARQVHIIP
jgi:hypothetical protein